MNGGARGSLDFIFFETGEMKDHLKLVGFELEEVIERDPYPEVEYPSRRAYIFARKPSLAPPPNNALSRRLNSRLP